MQRQLLWGVETIVFGKSAKPTIKLLYSVVFSKHRTYQSYCIMIESIEFYMWCFRRFWCQRNLHSKINIFMSVIGLAILRAFRRGRKGVEASLASPGLRFDTSSECLDVLALGIYSLYDTLSDEVRMWRRWNTNAFVQG